MIKVHIVDFKSDCSKRSKVWIKEGGQIRGTWTCGKQPIPEYIARSGKVTVGLDVAANAQVLITYNAVKSSRGSSVGTNGLRQLRNNLMGSKAGVNGLYQQDSANPYGQT